jgi:translation elongation factor P/translation initiation factor 5A
LTLSYNNHNNNGQQSGNNAKPAWNEAKKRQATSYPTKQLKEVVRITRKKALEDAKSQYESQAQEELHQIEIKENAAQELDKMRQMELFINNMVEDESNVMEEEDELTQAKLDEPTASPS